MTPIPKKSDHKHLIVFTANTPILKQDDDDFFKSMVNIYGDFKCIVEGCKLKFTADGEIQVGSLKDGQP